MNSKQIVLLIFFILSINIVMSGTSIAVDVAMPDYTILSLTPDTYTQMQGKNIVLTTVVKNKGPGRTLRNSSLVWLVCTDQCGLEDNWSIAETDTISGLDVGQEEIETYTHEVTFGSTEFKVHCDYDENNNFGVIIETNEDENYNKDTDNNISDTIIIETKKPDLAITIDPEGEYETQPLIWCSPKYPLEGQEVTFYAGITNRGFGGTIEDFDVEFKVYREGNPYNSVSLGKQTYKDGIPLGPMLENENFCYVSSKDTWPAEPGKHSIEAIVNGDGNVSENSVFVNNAQIQIDQIHPSNLRISNIWWVPQVPKDGEEVSFYASIENLGSGGSILEFDVDFILKERDNEGETGIIKPVELGTATVKDQILPAQKNPIKSGDFEASYLSQTNWQVIKGSVSIESHCAEDDSLCHTKLQNSNLKYVRLSGANSIIRSKEPIIVDNETLVFRAKSSGSGKRWLSLCKPDTDCLGSNQLITQEIETSKDNWQAYVMNVSKLIGETVGCELRTGTSTNTILKVDDIRMSTDDASGIPVMVSIPISDVWECYPFSADISFSPGSFEIEAKLSENNTLVDSDMTNQNHTESMQDQSPWIEPADYDFVSLNVSPPKQFIGKTFLYEVVIKNYGGPTIVDANMNWYLSEKENQFGNSLETDEIPGLGKNKTHVHTFELPVVSGNINIHAFINDDLLLKETNSWAQDDIRYNRASDIRFVNDVDLSVKKIWWRVENPLENQNLSEPLEGQKVRFYARIDNIAHGGAVTDFDVQFIVDEGQFEEVDLKTTTIKDDILFGRLGWDSQAGFTNAGFEGNCDGSDDKLCGWTIERGSVSAESYCGIDDTQCICSRLDDNNINVNAACNPNTIKGNLHYARLYGGGTVFSSGTFYVNGDIIEFKAQVTGSGTKKLRLCEENNPTHCKEETYSDKSFWNAYVLDVSEFIGKPVTIELSIEGSGNMEFWVDDFRMDVSSDNDVFVTTAESKNTWAATTGSHEISVKADIKNVLTEPDDYDPNNPSTNTNNVKRTIITKVNQTDYWIKQPADSEVQRKQIEGRPVHVMAEIVNIGSGTSLETDLYWYTCLDTDNPSCADQDNWKNTWGNPTTKVTVPALANGQSFTSVFTYTAQYGKTYIIAEVNPELNVSETYVNNNTVFYEADTEVNKPKLAVQAIWWLPEQPNDGEEVTFYAAIENVWSFDTGGTLEDFEVSFSVMDQTDPAQIEELGTTKIKDDIPMADRRIIDEFNLEDNQGVFATGINEVKNLAPWKRLSGGFSLIDRCEQQGTTCKENISNRYYVRLYGENTLLRSSVFDLVNDIIIFSGYTNGSGTKTIKIKKMLYSVPHELDPEIYSYDYTEKQTWRANLIKIEPGHTNEKVYIEALTRDAANAEFVIDDFRMAPPSTDNVFVTIAESSKVWTAQPGSFDISVAVSVDGAGGSGLKKELLSNDPNDTTFIKKADYIVRGPILDLEMQVKGKDIQATAYIENVGDTTLVESEIQWEIQWENGSKTATEKIEGIPADKTYTSTFTFTPEYGPNIIKVSADATNTIIEVNDENNKNEVSINLEKPELKIGSIWWSPASPRDGEEVTFFARIDNVGKGGSSEDLEVRFLVSQGQNGKQSEISKEKVSADVPFALGTAAFANSDFSGEDNSLCTGLPGCDSSDTLKNWDTYGEVFAESRCTFDDELCSEKITEMIDTPNMYQCGYESYARLYGNTTLRSTQPFKKMAVKYILFKAYASGSGDKKIQVLDKSYTSVIELPITDKSWAAQIIDVAPYNLDFNTQDYYFNAVIEGATNASLMIDDIRLVSTPVDTCRIMVAKVQASKNWIAQPKLSDSANNYYVHVEVTDSTNSKVIDSKEIDPVSKSDYQIKSITHEPQEQTKGKTVTFSALLENTGADTLVESELSWFTCYANCDDDTNWKKIWTEAQTETVSPLKADAQYTSTFVLTTEFGTNYVRVFCDSGNVIVEPDENVSLFVYNNIKDDSIDILKPDLRVSKIGHYPKKPIDGESIIFYAQIENVFDGGTIDEIETTFLVTDSNGVETTIEAEKSSNEVMFARRQLLFDNADFELGSMTNWKVEGSVFIEKESLTEQYYKIVASLFDARNDQYFVKIIGDGSKLLSSPFTINAQSIIFKGQTSGAGTKQVLIRKCSSTECTPYANDAILDTQNFTESSPWRNCILDVSEFHNQYVYLELKTSESDKSEFWVDDFRMKSGTDYTYVSTVQSKSGWTAFPGNHTLRATVDSKQAIPENEETNNNFLEGDFFLSNAVDYSVTSMIYTPEEQIQGKEIAFTALIQNIRKQEEYSTKLESELQWSVCQGEVKTCDHQNKWVVQSKEKVPGLAAGEIYTSTFNMEITYEEDLKSVDNYLLQVKVECDAGKVLAEDNDEPGAEDNNKAIQHIVVYHPDLKVGDIWWIPKNPVYGEEVTFYARIDNMGSGGSIQDFEVNFTVDYLNTEKAISLGETKVSTEIPFALRAPLGDNASFEGGLNPWVIKSGNVYWESKCPENDLECPDGNAKDRYGDLYYASVYGRNSIFQSEKFTPKGNSLLFRGMTDGSGTKKIIIYDEFDVKLIERSYTDKSPWRAYVIDIQKDDQGETIPSNENYHLYIEVQTSGSDNAKFMVDDFRMYGDSSKHSVIGYVESKNTWSATPDILNQGVHTITAIIDEKNDIKEVDEDNNQFSKDLKPIGRPDYKVKITDYSPRKQIQGRIIKLTAVVENPLSTTLLDSELKWSTCQGSKDTCQIGSDTNWTVQQTNKMTGGIAEGQQFTVIYNMTVPAYFGKKPTDNPDGYTIYVKVKADANNDIDEQDEQDNKNANEVIQQIEIDHPDLIINDFWMIPEVPVDGEEVTFYAQIQNQGSGGTLADYEVNFYEVTKDYSSEEEKTIEEDLGSTKIQDDIPLGNRLPIISYAVNSKTITKNIGDFESNTILSRSDSLPVSDWTRQSGEVYITNHFQEKVLPEDTSIVNNKKYLYVSGNSAIAISPPFELWGDAIMFRLQTNGSGNKILRLRPLNEGPGIPDPLIEKNYNDKSPWRAYLLDIEKWHKIIAYLEIETSGGLIQVDDFRMKETPDSNGTIYVATAVNSKKWMARNGSLIKVVVDSKNNIYEDLRTTYITKRSAGNYYSEFLSGNNDLRRGESNNIFEKTIILAKVTDKLGDVDGNGKRELTDLIIAAQIVANFNVSLNNSASMEKIDVDNDNQIGLAEIIYLMVFIAGK